ncbi:MAG: hypothetical protein IV100_08485 [Myxococcales bacterium]|nr:hypothetical protein [Myxococcales bacterium]
MPARVPSITLLIPMVLTALIVGWFHCTDLPPYRGQRDAHPVDADDPAPPHVIWRLGTTRGPPVRVQCPLDGHNVDVSPIKSRLHRPLLHGGPDVEKIYTCPICGYAGTAADWIAAPALSGVERRRLARSLSTWVRESPAGRAALIQVDDSGAPTFARALMAGRAASTNADRIRWLEVALASSDRVRPFDVVGAGDRATTGSLADVAVLRATLRAAVLLELGRAAEAQAPLGQLDRTAPEQSFGLRARFGLASLPGWW